MPKAVDWKTVGAVLTVAGGIFWAGSAQESLSTLKTEMTYVRAKVDAIYRSLPADNPQQDTVRCGECKVAHQ